MADVLKRLDDIVWSRRTYTPRELSARSKCFPMVVKIVESPSGDYFYNKFSVDQVLYLYGVKEQLRFFAQDLSQNQITIPVNSPITFLELGRDAEVILTQDMPLPQYIEINLQHFKPELSQLMSLTEEDGIVLSIRQRGWMKYLMGICLSKGEVSRCMETIPVDYGEIRFSVALDLQDETIEDFLKFESCLRDLVVSIHQDQLGSYQGNTDFITNSQPNFIQGLEGISAPTIEIHVPVSDSSNDKSGGKELTDSYKTLPRKTSDSSYIDVNLSEVESSSYQDLTAISDSSEEYDYPDIDEDYEMIDENLQLKNELLPEQLSLDDATRQQHHSNVDGYLTTNAILKSKENNLVPIKHESRKTKKEKGSSSDDDKEYLVPMTQEANMKKKKQTTLEDDEDYLVPMTQQANAKKKKQTLEDDKDYLVPMKQEANAKKKKQTLEDDKDYLVPMKQEANAKKKKQTLEDDKDYLVPMKQEANAKKKKQTLEDDKDYLVPMKQEANAKKKKQTTLEDDDEYLVPMIQEEVDDDYMNDYIVIIETEVDAKNIKQMTLEGNKAYEVMKKETHAKKMKKTISEDDKGRLLLKQRADANKDGLVTMKPKVKVKKLQKKKKENSSETSKHQITQDHEAGHVPTKDDTHTNKNEKPLSAGRKQRPQKNGDKEYLGPPKHLSQGQDTAQQMLCKQTGQDVLRIPPQRHKELQSKILAEDIITQSRKLKPIMPLPVKKDTVNKSGKSVMVSVDFEAIQFQSKVSTQSKETVEGSVSTHIEEIIEGSKHKSNVKKALRPVVAQRPPKVKDAMLYVNMKSPTTEDMKSRKVDMNVKLPPPPPPPKPHKK